MLIETRNLILRDYREPDKEKLSLICSDSVIMKLVLNGPNPPGQFNRFVTDNFASKEQKIGLGTLCLKENNMVIGFAGFKKFNFYKSNTGEVEFGFVIHNDWHGKGFATEIGKAQIYYALNNLGLKTVFARAHPLNDPSIHVLKDKLELMQVSEDVVENRLTFMTTERHHENDYYLAITKPFAK